VREARQLGYTEPDPRDDLSGLDVARKLIILAREMGLSLELADVEVESLAPKALETVSTDEFMERLAEFDAAMLQRLEAARSRGKVLRHVGSVTADGAAKVGLVELDANASLANTALTDNIVRYSTRRYSVNPLIVQGPGAGPLLAEDRSNSSHLRVFSKMSIYVHAAVHPLISEYQAT
jgi:aspartokinase/homoserine dehydrogenase 1